MFSCRNQASQSNIPYEMIQNMNVFNGENHRNQWIHGGYIHGLSSHVWLPKGPRPGNNSNNPISSSAMLPASRTQTERFSSSIGKPAPGELQQFSRGLPSHRTSVNIGEHRWSLEWLWKFIPPKYVVTVLMIYVTNCYNRFWSILKSCTKSPWSYE